MKATLVSTLICLACVCSCTGLVCYQKQKISDGVFVTDLFKLEPCPEFLGDQIACLRTEKEFGGLGGYVLHGECVPVDLCQNISCSPFRIGGVGSEIILENTCNITCCYTDGCNNQTVEAIIQSGQNSQHSALNASTSEQNATNLSPGETTLPVDTTPKAETTVPPTSGQRQSTPNGHVASTPVYNESSSHQESSSVIAMLSTYTSAQTTERNSPPSTSSTNSPVKSSTNGAFTSTTKGNSSSNLLPSALVILGLLLCSIRQCL